MLAELNWVFIVPVSILSTVCLTVSLVLCICGRRIKEPKNELVGIEGRVKITNPEEYQQEVNANNISTEISSDKVQNTAKRSLPDLPVDSQANARSDVTWEPNGDATSELYATVVLQDEKNKKHNRQISDSDSMSPSMTYTKVKKDHPYDKLKKVEHPYAQVKDHEGDKRASDVDSRHSNNASEEKETRNVQQFESEIVDSNRTGIESAGNILAATAITGRVTASDDLPYMTPPAHFSGDSQDSGKGYTSISVREPLSAIRAESSAAAASNRRADPHYATVLDDSDDMYAAIEDPSQAYTSGSETYARIHTGSNRPKSAPQPPSVDSLKQMTITSQSNHSRQDSSSSLASSTAVSSPKPEKRPANSPLPPTPTKSPDSMDESDRNSRRSGSPRNVEDMYAKVNKKIRREMDHLERGGSTESGVSESSDSLSFKLQASTTESSRSCHSHLSKSTLADTATASSSSNGRIPTIDSSFASSETDPRCGYENLEGSSFEFDRKSDPGYETLNKRPSSESDPEYEKLQPAHRTSPGGYEDLGKPETDGYASVDRETEFYSKIDASGGDGYAKVLKRGGDQETGAEPGYEKVCFSGSEGEREERRRSGERVGEPTYESLADGVADGEDQNDPDYESVRFSQKKEIVESPAYGLLSECETGASAEI